MSSVTDRLDQLAADIGRLRRRHPDDQLIERVADQILSIAAILQPSAAELAARNTPEDQDAVVEAIRIVDERSRRLCRLLGEAA